MMIYLLSYDYVVMSDSLCCGKNKLTGCFLGSLKILNEVVTGLFGLVSVFIDYRYRYLKYRNRNNHFA